MEELVTLSTAYKTRLRKNKQEILRKDNMFTTPPATAASL